ncbi:MAG: metallophosphoesterase family protein, partial [Armatimonadota bacterium]
LDCITVLGNHDAAVAGLMDLGWFNLAARSAVLWTRAALSEADARSLSILPLTYAGPEFMVVHGSLARPSDFPYILSPGEARQCFEEMGDHELCFVGHSHVCEVYVQKPGVFGVDQIEMPKGGKVDLKPGLRYIVNCGSVGQPRDGNPNASCAIFDSQAMTVELIRVGYDIGAVQDRMRRAGLPQMLIDRLEYGL